MLLSNPKQPNSGKASEQLLEQLMWPVSYYSWGWANRLRLRRCIYFFPQLFISIYLPPALPVKALNLWVYVLVLLYLIWHVPNVFGVQGITDFIGKELLARPVGELQSVWIRESVITLILLLWLSLNASNASRSFDFYLFNGIGDKICRWRNVSVQDMDDNLQSLHILQQNSLGEMFLTMTIPE